MSRLTKKQLRDPDQFWKASATAYEWAKEQWPILAITAGVMFLGLFFWIFWAELNKQKEAEAQHQFAEAASLFEQWRLEDAGELKETSQAELIVALERLDEEFPRSKARSLARLFWASIAIEEGDWSAAEESFEEYMRVLPRRQRDLALYPLAILFEDQERYDEALAQYQSILRLDSSAYRAWALLGEARMYRQTGRPKLAIQSYTQFLEEFPDRPERTQVRGLRAMAEGEI